MPSNNGTYENSLIGLAKNYGNYYEDIDSDFGAESWSYVIDPETYEMLLLKAKKGNDTVNSFNDWQGSVCYKYLEGRDAPCENCHAKNAGWDNYYVCTKIDPRSGKRYFIENILIEHNGKPAILQKVIDISDENYRDRVINEYISTKISPIRFSARSWRARISLRTLRRSAGRSANILTRTAHS